MSTTIQAALLATVLTSAVWYLLLAAMTKLHRQDIAHERQTIQELKDTVIDLEARVRPFNYELRADGVNVIVERGRLDLPEPRESVEPTVNTINLTEFGDDGLPT